MVESEAHAQCQNSAIRRLCSSMCPCAQDSLPLVSPCRRRGRRSRSLCRSRFVREIDVVAEGNERLSDRISNQHCAQQRCHRRGADDAEIRLDSAANELHRVGEAQGPPNYSSAHRAGDAAQRRLGQGGAQSGGNTLLLLLQRLLLFPQLQLRDSVGDGRCRAMQKRRDARKRRDRP